MSTNDSLATQDHHHDDRRLAILSAISRRRRLLSYTSVTRCCCEESLKVVIGDDNDPAAAFKQAAIAAIASSSRSNSVPKPLLKKRGSVSFVKSAKESNNVYWDKASSSSLSCNDNPAAAAGHEKRKRKRSSASSANVTSSEPSHRIKTELMELSSHASFAMQRREELLKSLSGRNVSDDGNCNYSIVLPVHCSSAVSSAVSLPIDSSSSSSSGNHNSAISPLRLPSRQKTQWDELLHEMKLVSEDYMQERRWKIGCGKVMAVTAAASYSDGDGEDHRVHRVMRKQQQQKKNEVHSPIRGERNNENDATDNNIVNDATTNANSAEMATPPRFGGMYSNNFTSSNGDGALLSSFHPLSLLSSIYNTEPLVDDSKTIAHTLSVAIRDYWKCCGGGGSSSENETVLCMNPKQRLDAMQQNRNDATIANCRGGEKTVDASTATTAATGTIPTMYGKENHNVQSIACSSDEEISKRIQSILDSIGSFHNSQISMVNENNSISHSGECAATKQSNKVNLHPSQMQVVSSIESLWKNNTDNDIINNAAAVLSGDYGTGKTVCTCYILAKQRFATATTNTMGRKNGMQIVLCPIGSLLRWKMELDKFNNLRVDFLSTHSPTAIHTSTNDVMLCDYQTFIQKTKDQSLLVEPSCIYIDLRYSLEETTTSGRLFQSDIFELWDAINMLLLTHPAMRRLLIEPLSENNHLDSSNTINNRGDAKMGAKILAMKMACIYHPLLFASLDSSASSSSYVGKRVVSWVHSQRCVLDNMLNMNLNLSDTTNDSSPPSVYLFQSILIELTTRVRFVINSDSSGGKSDEDPWELREVQPCKETLQYSSESLHQGNHSVQWQNLSRIGMFGEPNADAAREMMQSPKMKELFLLLVNECGVDIGEAAVYLPKLPTDNVSTEVHEKKKALILASQSVARKSITFFLSCLGIRNRVLEATCSAGWDRIQNSIVLFNGESDSRTHILISSPSVVSSLNGGVCPMAANVVILVDQDMDSSDAHLSSLVKKIRRNAQDGTCKFVKITDDRAVGGSGEGEKGNGLVCNGNSLADPSSHAKIHTTNASVHGAFKEANAKQHQLLPYGLEHAAADANKPMKLGIYTKSFQAPPFENSSYTAIRHYVRSFSSTQTANNALQTEKAAAPRETIVPKQKAKPPKKTNTDKARTPDINTILAYDIPTTSTIDRFSESKPRLHLLGSCLARDTALSNDTRGFESLVYLPACHDGESNANRKRPMSVDTESCIEVNSYSCRAENSNADHFDLDNNMQWPRANSIILVAQRPQLIGGNSINGQSTSSNAAAADSSSQSAGQIVKPDEKKQDANKKPLKRQHSSIEDKLTSTFFKKARPMRRSFATRDAMRSYNSASIMLPVKLQCCLLQAKDTSARKLGPSKERSASWTDGDNKLVHRASSHYDISGSTRSLSECRFHWGAPMLDKTESAEICQSSKVLKVAGDSSFIYNKLRLSESDSMQNQSYVGSKEHWVQRSNAKFKHSQPTNMTDEKQLIALLKKSSTKRRSIPPTITGKTTVDGRTSVRMMPAHASHHETVHPGYARKEMWPLELISHNEKNSSLNSAQHLSQTYHQPRQYNGVSHISRIPMQGARNNKYEPSKK
ncbi:hypothetical protein ACHAXN_003810 [Cyclotella atomus]